MPTSGQRPAIRCTGRALASSPCGPKSLKLFDHPVIARDSSEGKAAEYVGSSPQQSIPGSLQGQQSRRSALNCQNLLECLDSDLFVAAFDANDHLILIANRHFQLHRVVLLHDRARGADAGIQQALEPLIAIRGKYRTPSSVAIARGTPRARQAALHSWPLQRGSCNRRHRQLCRSP